MKQTKYLWVLLLICGIIGCTPTPAAPPPSPTDPPADTAVPAPVEDESLWNVALQMTVEQPMRMAAFLDDKVGFTGGEADPGKAYYTTDGGAVWTMAETSIG